MHKILQNHLLCAFVANLKIDALYALYPESFCGKNLAIWKVFAFCDSEPGEGRVIYLVAIKDTDTGQFSIFNIFDYSMLIIRTKIRFERC